MAKRMPDPAPDPDETDTDTDETNGETDETTEPVEETKPPTAEPKPKPDAPKAPVGKNRIGIDDDPANRVYVENPSTSGGLEQRISVGGTYYEHSGQDAEGTWLYRQVK